MTLTKCIKYDIRGGKMKIDAIIPVCNPDKRLYELIKRLLKQKRKLSKIHIILTVTEKYGVTDFMKGLAENALRDRRLKVTAIDKASFNHGGTRQMAAEDSDADYCLFMTQDALPSDNCLIGRMISEFEDADIAVCYARQLPCKKAVLKERYARSYNYPSEPMIKDRSMLEDGKIKAIFCSDVCAMYDMKIFRKLDGFFRKTDFNEDMMYAHKALKNGYMISYSPGARVYHSHNLSLKQQFKRNIEIAKSQKEHPEVFGKLSSESEGVSYLKTGIKYMAKNGKMTDVIGFVADCGFRFAGFKAGKLFK